MPRRVDVSDDQEERAFSVQSIERAVRLLECFGLEEAEIGVSELSQKLGLHKSTVCRLLQSLEAADFVRQNPESGKYYLGLFPIRLAGHALSRFQIREVALPFLIRLAQTVDETINLAVFNRTEVINIFQIPSRRAIKHVGWLGRPNPIHCTSGGKIVLGFLPQAERDALLAKPLIRYTSHTITDRAELLDQVNAARAQGYAVARDEFEEELTGIAAPVLDFNDQLVGVVGITGPTYRMTETRVREFAEVLKNTTQEISVQLGYIPDAQGSPRSLLGADRLAALPDR